MPDLSTIRTNILAHLLREAGTTEWWTSDTVDSVINFLYRTLARQFRNIKEPWSRTSVTTTNTIYKIPTKFLAVNECTWDGESLDPRSIYEIKMMDVRWRERGGHPTYYCLDYREGFILLWYFPSSEKIIEIVGSVVPENLSASEVPSSPYANGLILETGSVSFILAGEGGGQNLERASYWYDIFTGELAEVTRPKMSMDHSLRSIEEKRGLRRGPRYPDNYPIINWGILPKTRIF